MQDARLCVACMLKGVREAFDHGSESSQPHLAPANLTRLSVAAAAWCVCQHDTLTDVPPDRQPCHPVQRQQ